MKKKIICISIVSMFLLTGLTALPALGIKANVTEMKSDINLTTSSNNDDKPDLEIVYLDIFRLKQERPEGFPLTYFRRFDLGIRITVKNNGPGDIPTDYAPYPDLVEDLTIINASIRVDGQLIRDSIWLFPIHDGNDFYPGDWKADQEREFWTTILIITRPDNILLDIDFYILLENYHNINDFVEHTFEIKIDSDDKIDEGEQGETNNIASITYAHTKQRAINTPLFKFLEHHPILFQLLQRFLKL